MLVLRESDHVCRNPPSRAPLLYLCGAPRTKDSILRQATLEDLVHVAKVGLEALVVESCRAPSSRTNTAACAQHFARTLVRACAAAQRPEEATLSPRNCRRNPSCTRRTARWLVLFAAAARLAPLRASDSCGDSLGVCSLRLLFRRLLRLGLCGPLTARLCWSQRPPPCAAGRL